MHLLHGEFLSGEGDFLGSLQMVANGAGITGGDIGIFGVGSDAGVPFPGTGAFFSLWRHHFDRAFTFNDFDLGDDEEFGEPPPDAPKENPNGAGSGDPPKGGSSTDGGGGTDPKQPR